HGQTSRHTTPHKPPPSVPQVPVFGKQPRRPPPGAVRRCAESCPTPGGGPTMLEKLAEAIRDKNVEVTKVFATPFRNPAHWVDFIKEHFGGRTFPTVDRILNEGNDAKWKDAGWATEKFQALYVACWIFNPVEKGSFMIKLNEHQRANLKKGYQ